MDSRRWSWGQLSPQKSRKKKSRLNWRERFRKLSLFGPSGFFFDVFFWVIANDGGVNTSSPSGLVGSFSSFSEKKAISVMRQKFWRIGKKDGKLQGLVLQSRKPLGSSCDSYIPLTRFLTSTIIWCFLGYQPETVTAEFEGTKFH